MKRNPEFVIRQVADRFVLVPVGEAAESFSGMITINSTGNFLWELLKTEQSLDELAQALVREYGIELQRAQTDVEAFLKPILPTGAIIE